ncbi:MAG: DUF503 domain-containing protein [bacterium]|nr:DUF503 domain-containing protein [bacterium]
MIVGIMVLDLLSKNTHSLKQKRQIVSSIKEKLKHRFNISISETGNLELWQNIQLAVAMVSNSKVVIEKAFEQIEDYIFSNYPVQLIRVDKEYI